MDWLPYVFSGLLCPLLMGGAMFFMMRGRGNKSEQAPNPSLEARLATLEREKAELEARVAGGQEGKRK